MISSPTQILQDILLLEKYFSDILTNKTSHSFPFKNFKTSFILQQLQYIFIKGFLVCLRLK